jgi:hypothetical protein
MLTMNDPQELTFDERVLQEAFGDWLIEMRQLGESAPDGAVLNALEGLTLSKGRDILRRALEGQVQAVIEAVEKKGSRPARTVASPRKIKAPAPAKS